MCEEYLNPKSELIFEEMKKKYPSLKLTKELIDIADGILPKEDGYKDIEQKNKCIVSEFKLKISSVYQESINDKELITAFTKELEFSKVKFNGDVEIGINSSRFDDFVYVVLVTRKKQTKPSKTYTQKTPVNEPSAPVEPIKEIKPKEAKKGKTNKPPKQNQNPSSPAAPKDVVIETLNEFCSDNMVNEMTFLENNEFVEIVGQRLPEENMSQLLSERFPGSIYKKVSFRNHKLNVKSLKTRLSEYQFEAVLVERMNQYSLCVISINGNHFIHLLFTKNNSLPENVVPICFLRPSEVVFNEINAIRQHNSLPPHQQLDEDNVKLLNTFATQCSSNQALILPNEATNKDIKVFIVVASVPKEIKAATISAISSKNKMVLSSPGSKKLGISIQKSEGTTTYYVAVGLFD